MMPKIGNWTRPAALAVMFISLVSCAPTAGVNTSIQRQANVSSTQGLNERLAILDIRGNNGNQMMDTLTGALASHQVNGKPYFSLVDRGNLDKIMGEVARSQSGLIDDNSAVEIGKLSGAKGILTGTYERLFEAPGIEIC